jgi:hypothetical protein
LVAFLRIDRFRRYSTAKQIVNLGNRLFAQLPETDIEIDGLPAPFLPIKQGPAFYLHSQHLFKTERLSTKLHLVAAIAFRLASLVLDREDRAVRMEFHDIGLAAQTKPMRADREGTYGTYPPLPHFFPTIRPLVQYPAFGSEPVFDPDLFDMDQGALARAVQIVLQGGEHDEVGFGIHLRHS